MPRQARLTSHILILLTITLATGCASTKPALKPPQSLLAPYDTLHGDVLWAVVPLRNESGTSLINTLAVSDQVVAAVEQIEGVRALPLNRTIEALRSLAMIEPATPADARKLATEMGVDAIIVGSITAWDPYAPPTIGLSLALYAMPGLMSDREPVIDTRELTYQPTEYQYFLGGVYEDRPASVVSDVLDGANHQVLMDLDRFVAGRSDPTNVLGSQRYLASMDHFAEFASWRVVGQLVEEEWIRLASHKRVANTR